MKISLDDLDKLELASAPARQEINPDEDLTAIFKVNKSKYVPKCVKLRARIDPKRFTGSFTARHLKSIESDKNVISVALSKPLRMID